MPCINRWYQLVVPVLNSVTRTLLQASWHPGSLKSSRLIKEVKIVFALQRLIAKRTIKHQEVYLGKSKYGQKAQDNCYCAFPRSTTYLW